MCGRRRPGGDDAGRCPRAGRLAGPLAEGRATSNDLEAVQARRLLPTRVTQRLQVMVQNRIIRRVLAGEAELTPPVPPRVISRVPLLQRIPARLVGIGIRPEHIRTPAR